MLVLRNAATRAEARSVTSKGGAYHFDALAPGEYILEAASPAKGRGTLDGIVVSAGHESHVVAALELLPAEETRASAGPGNSSPSVSEPPVVSSLSVPASAIALFTIKSSINPSADPVITDPRISLQPQENLTLQSGTTGITKPTRILQPYPLPTSTPVAEKPQPAGAASPAPLEPLVTVATAANPAPIAEPMVHGTAIVIAPVLAVTVRSAGPNGFALAALAVAQAALQSRDGSPQILGTLQDAPATAAVSEPNLTGEQLQALPLQGRHWENFLLDATKNAAGADEDPAAEAGRSSERSTASARVDGASTALAFGGPGRGRTRGASLLGPGHNETALSEVQPFEESRSMTGEQAGPEVATRKGSQGLHGQFFLFDHQNAFGARNPFTQWVKETTPGTLVTTPTFSPIPFTPSDRDYSWGAGIGSRIPHSRFFWFAALDGSHRNNPGVSMVKHPDHFFAQPSNDEMQVLSARLGLSAANPVAEGLKAYSGILEKLATLLGPTQRTAEQWVGFARLDWQAAERHRFTLEGTGAQWNSPGGGLTRISEPNGSHSFGTSRASEQWMLARWEAFLTPNLLAVTQGSAARHILTLGPQTPSAFEQTLNVSAWGQLPQIVVDSRYGFTIGNPSRFGNGSFPDEHLYEMQEALDWVHGSMMLKAGVDWRHNADATSMIRNHGGTYHYATVENFASDALAFSAYGLVDSLDPRNQHNCDQRGRAWRDSTRQLHGLGYLPCYSYYSQTLGPTNWHLSTNDLAGYVTSQWQPARKFVLSASLRWEREFLPPPIALVNNPDLPGTQKLPDLGNQWAPRLSAAWGVGESHWPTLRLGYGLYYGRIQNSVIETALTQTGSPKGNLNLFLRPSDNLNAGGAPPFPYVLAGEPGTIVKPGTVEFAPRFQNAEIHQAEATVEERLAGRVLVQTSAVVSLGRRLPVTIDTNFDPAVNPGTITYAVVDALGAGPLKSSRMTVPFFASWPAFGSRTAAGGRLDTRYQQITELSSRANSTYEAAILRISRAGRRGFTFHARYTYAHAMDWNPNESTLVSGSGVLDPTDFRQEYGTGNLDIRHSVSGMLIWQSPWKLKNLAGRLGNGWMLSGIGQFHSGLPFTMHTAGGIPELFETNGAAIVGLGPGMNGSGGENRVYGVGRNTYRYPFTWKADLRMGKKFNLGAMRQVELMAESFNLFNHQNVTRLETIGYTIAPGSAEVRCPPSTSSPDSRQDRQSLGNRSTSTRTTISGRDNSTSG